jgi:uncharacterized protein
VQVSARLFDPSRTDAELIETHISTVALEADVVHKRKKAVKLAFVDLSTPDRRELLCHREVEVNRRFSPDVYLGVEDVVDESGNVVDHAVRMQRMPADRRLSTLARGHADLRQCIRQIARLIAIAHAQAPTSTEIASVASPAALARLWDQNLREMEVFSGAPLDPEMLAAVAALAHQYIDGRHRLLLDRIARGLVLDGHGDLLADDTYCLDDGPRVLDCLEFDDRLRWGDVLYDVGFLAMDLERLGRPELARLFLDAYREYAGESHPPTLEEHYVAYRALVRSKISCLRGTPADHDEARAYLTQCVAHLRAGRVRLVVVGGLPGTGKSTVAMAVGEALGWPVLRSDEVRKQRAGLSASTSAAAPYQQGLYAPDQIDATYTAMLDAAALMLGKGSSVILDASFSSNRWREAAREVATRTASEMVELCCVLRRDLAVDRLAERSGRGDASDADVDVADAMRGAFDEWLSATQIDTGPPRAVVIAHAQDVIAPERARSS